MISHPSTSDRQRTVEFQALPTRTDQVRRIVSAQLRYWKLDGLVRPAALGVTELLANVHRHVAPDRHCTVEIALRPGRVTVSVRDHDPNMPPLHPSGVLATHGRGLALVAAVSDSWGMRIQRDGTGKVVWFTLPVPVPVPARTAAPGRRAGAPDGTPRQEPLPSPAPLPAPEPLPRPDPLPRGRVSAPAAPAPAAASAAGTTVAPVAHL
ncbi:ATP-binding protein [Streptomyces carminius]|uniref:ATP-binding protein n=1 Tax=Streptomyces carminius TaxID=2665496 RepID=A0A2M8LY55_9ACTN|nr:ATP-binding protein [Streptomyces carminius]PJE96854.1 ATP-binding protein [Streptomyces carminius]